MENEQNPQIFIEDIFEIFDNNMKLDEIDDDELKHLADEFKDLDFETNGFLNVIKSLNSKLESFDTNGEDEDELQN